MKIGWNKNHQHKLMTLKDKDSLIDTEIPKLLWVIQFTTTSYMKWYKFMKWYIYIAQVPRVQVFKLLLTKSTKCFLKCAQCLVLGWEKQVSSETSLFWKELRWSRKASLIDSLTDVPSEYNASLGFSCHVSLYIISTLSGWVSPWSMVLLRRRKEGTDVG